MTIRPALTALALALALTQPAFAAAEKKPVCEKAALGALVKLPQLPLACQEDSSQFCSSDTPSTLYDDPSCKAAAGKYAKTLDRILTPRWWSAMAETLEACRMQGKPGALTQDEDLELGPGELVQGTDKVRMLVLPDLCGAGAMSNVVLVVRTAHGNAVTPLYFSFNQGGQEGPFSLDVATQGADTYALFTTEGHDMQNAYTTTMAYRIDPASGAAALYPLFIDETGETAMFTTSEPVVEYTSTDQTAMITPDGHFRPWFVRHTSHGCDPDDAKCIPVKKQTYRWNGKAFVADGVAVLQKNYAPRLSAQRACLASNFDAKKGSAACDVGMECEGDNNLSLLAYKAGLFDRAKQYAADALEYCNGRAQPYAAAEFNYLRAKKAVK
jgi:hypothetical protein